MSAAKTWEIALLTVYRYVHNKLGSSTVMPAHVYPCQREDSGTPPAAT